MLIRLFRRIRDSRALHYVVAAASVAAGFFYVAFPPLTTIGYMEASWPPRAWGVALLAGGIVKLVGLGTRILDWQLLGLVCLFTGWAALAVAQSLVMAGPPFAPTRGGGTIGLWVLVTYVVTQIIAVACDREDGRQASNQIEGR